MNQGVKDAFLKRGTSSNLRKRKKGRKLPVRCGVQTERELSLVKPSVEALKRANSGRSTKRIKEKTRGIILKGTQNTRRSSWGEAVQIQKKRLAALLK